MERVKRSKYRFRYNSWNCSATSNIDGIHKHQVSLASNVKVWKSVENLKFYTSRRGRGPKELQSPQKCASSSDLSILRRKKGRIMTWPQMLFDRKLTLLPLSTFTGSREFINSSWSNFFLKEYSPSKTMPHHNSEVSGTFWSKITSKSELTQIQHSLLRDVEQCSVDLEHSGTRSDNHADLASPVEVSINVVRLVHCKAKSHTERVKNQLSFLLRNDLYRHSIQWEAEFNFSAVKEF